ncbi:hypothetical protein CM49_00771 [Paenibacillus sp. P1XP2]|nr:hypothetical protein CM49_00771 [Paenibacillus sp. P1XP2]
MQPSHNELSEFYDYDVLFEELANQEPRSVAWRFNQRPLDDYVFSKHEVPLPEYLEKFRWSGERRFPKTRRPNWPGCCLNEDQPLLTAWGRRGPYPK